MKRLVFRCLFFLPLLCVAQSFSAPWDVSQTAKALAEQVDKLSPIIDELKPQEWQAKGAPPVFNDQIQNVRNEVSYLTRAARGFERAPERLPLALETYFRMQAVEGQIGSLVEAVTKYQTPQLGDRLRAAVVENSTNRDQLRRYIGDLAETREQELRVIDQEAQRCRDLLVRTPPSVKPVNAPASRPPAIPSPTNPGTANSNPANSSPASPSPARPNRTTTSPPTPSATVPNATSPNPASPSSSTPNATAPNPTVPNATAGPKPQGNTKSQVTK